MTKLNTAGWLQPCDVALFGPAKQKVRKQHKLDRQSDIQPYVSVVIVDDELI